jgi:hypothetical protein
LSGTIIWQSNAEFNQSVALPENLIPGTYLLHFTSSQKEVQLLKRLVIK